MMPSKSRDYDRSTRVLVLLLLLLLHPTPGTDGTLLIYHTIPTLPPAPITHLRKPPPPSGYHRTKSLQMPIAHLE